MQNKSLQCRLANGYIDFECYCHSQDVIFPIGFASNFWSKGCFRRIMKIKRYLSVSKQNTSNGQHFCKESIGKKIHKKNEEGKCSKHGPFLWEDNNANSSFRPTSQPSGVFNLTVQCDCLLFYLNVMVVILSPEYFFLLSSVVFYTRHVWRCRSLSW